MLDTYHNNEGEPRPGKWRFYLFAFFAFTIACYIMLAMLLGTFNVPRLLLFTFVGYVLGILGIVTFFGRLLGKLFPILRDED